MPVKIIKHVWMSNVVGVCVYLKQVWILFITKITTQRMIKNKHSSMTSIIDKRIWPECLMPIRQLNICASRDASTNVRRKRTRIISSIAIGTVRDIGIRMVVDVIVVSGVNNSWQRWQFMWSSRDCRVWGSIRGFIPNRYRLVNVFELLVRHPIKFLFIAPI